MSVPVPYIQSYTTYSHNRHGQVLHVRHSPTWSLRFWKAAREFRLLRDACRPWNEYSVGLSSVRKRDCAWASPTQGKKDFL